MIRKTLLAVVFCTDRLFQYLIIRWGKLRNTLFWKFTSATEREAWTVQKFSRLEEYSPGGTFYSQGLFDWENLMIEKHFPKSGRILVGGCGGGREIRVLCSRGYGVTGFEPSEEFFSQAMKLKNAFESLQLFQASYKNFLPHVKNSDPFDAVILGWGSLCHVTDNNDRKALFSLLKSHSPRAVILSSFYVAPDSYTGSRDLYWPHAGFVHSFTREEIEKLASVTGYKVVDGYFLYYPQAYAVFAPDLEQ